MEPEKYIVRLYDGFDNQWIDISEPLDCDEALRIWLENTDGGAKHTCFGDIDYYKIFPANTAMLFSNGVGEIKR